MHSASAEHVHTNASAIACMLHDPRTRKYTIHPHVMCLVLRPRVGMSTEHVPNTKKKSRLLPAIFSNRPIFVYFNQQGSKVVTLCWLICLWPVRGVASIDIERVEVKVRFFFPIFFLFFLPRLKV